MANILFGVIFLSCWRFGVSGSSPSDFSPKVPLRPVRANQIDFYYQFPIDKEYTWKQINPTQLKCPPPHRPNLVNSCGTVSSSENITYIKEGSANEFLIPGYNCYKAKFTSKCYTNFLSSQDKSHQYEVTRPRIFECQEEIQRIQESGSEAFRDELYPPFKCSWMRTKVNSQSMVIAQPRSLHYDPYKNKFTDPEIRDHCDSKICQTSHPGTIWIKRDDSPVCQNLVSQHFTFLYDTDGKPCGLEADGDFTWDLKGACSLRFCGIPGLQTSHHRWWGTSKASLFPPCSQASEVSLDDTTDLIFRSKFSLLEDLQTRLCHLVKSEIISKNTASSIQLSLFRPAGPGPNWAYRLNRGRVERAWVDYVSLRTVRPEKEEIIGQDVNGHTRRWTHWIPTSDKNVSYGPNGLFKVNGKIMIPDLEDWEEEQSTFGHLNTGLKPVEHITVSQLEDHRLQKISSTDFSTDVEVTFDWRDWIPDYYIAYIITGAVLLISIGLCCFRRCKVPKSGNPPLRRSERIANRERALQEFEMGSFYN